MTYMDPRPEGLNTEKAPESIVEMLASSWQPIETAPQGTMILCANMRAMEAKDWAYVAWIVNGKVYGHRSDMPTHWMPLPAAPTDEAKNA